MTTQGLESARFASFAELIKLQYALAITFILLKVFMSVDTAPWPLSIGLHSVMLVLCVLRVRFWVRLPSTQVPEAQAAIALETSKRLVVVAACVFLANDLALYAYATPSQRVFIIVMMLMGCACQLFYFVCMPQTAVLTASLFGVTAGIVALINGDLTVVAIALGIGSIIGIMSHAVHAYHQRFIALVAAHADLRRLGAENERLASTDVLTGLPNRREFFRAKAAVHQKALVQGTSFAIGIADLDGFKAANDRFGHRIGDEVLAVVAGRLREAAGARATVYSLGGDEFAFIVEDVVHPDLLTLLGESMIASINRPIACNGTAVTVGCSIGLAMYPQSTRDITQLYEVADEALYASKHRGRGCVTLARACDGAPSNSARSAS